MYMGANVLEKTAASIFRVKNNLPRKKFVQIQGREDTDEY
jgi:hypothetical protein